MFGQDNVYITKAVFFETKIPKHKPVFVSGREFYSLTYRYSGEASISVGGEKLVSKADSVTFMPKGLAYTTEVIEDVYMGVVHFDLACEHPASLPMVISAENTAIGSLFRALMKNSGDSSAELLKMSIFYEILAALEELESGDGRNSVPTKIARAKEIMDEGFCDPYFSVTVLAERVEVSPAYLRREFRRAFGSSPIAYLKELRIKKAKFLLLTERYSSARLAAECGYSCPSYFIQDFHKATGESPGSYREKLLGSP